MDKIWWLICIIEIQKWDDIWKIINKIYNIDKIEGTVLNMTIEVKIALYWDLPAGPVVSMQGSWVPSLVREVYPTTKSSQAAIKTRRSQIDR